MAGYRISVRTPFGEQEFHYEWFEDVTLLLGDMLRGTREIDLKIIREREDEREIDRRLP